MDPVNSKDNVKKNKPGNLAVLSALLVLLVIMLFASGALNGTGFFKGSETQGTATATNKGYVIKTPGATDISSAPIPSATADPVKETPLPVTAGSSVKIHFIDVGKGDAIFIESGGNTMLIDSGYNKNGKDIVNYISNLGYDTINVLVGTHPHEDHIGGMGTVIKKLKIRKFYMPDIQVKDKDYDNVIEEAADKGLMINYPSAGEQFMLGDAQITILSPAAPEYREINDYSIVIRMRFGEKSFLFAGDIQSDVERDLINSGYNLSSDLIKVPYHGGDTASSMDFLSRVKPSFAVITCEEADRSVSDNVIKRYNSIKTKIYRTDYNGTIVCTSDGKDIKIEAGR